ncbi:hypothetical protein PGT21_015523 [Puccinia graminis f. sp. tritici]|uniref:Uncharacterized protein n=1 Tax=Puccinia graminis f. sp. tritici TaxID=56615 RepID=A0A5B0MFK3_PUCGR|nr:hypothetical protein PGT21_015523 [Puccinia graminis f. sp. tritici]
MICDQSPICHFLGVVFLRKSITPSIGFRTDYHSRRPTYFRKKHTVHTLRKHENRKKT